MIKSFLCRFFILFVLVFTTSILSKAAILPADGAYLNQTQVMFQIEDMPGATHFSIKVYNTYAADSSKNMLTFYTNSLAKLVSQGLEFGNSYTWYYEAFKGSKSIFVSQKFHFNILTSYVVDTNLFRYSVTKYDTAKASNNLVFLDNHGVLINKIGKPVWYMPTDENNQKTALNYRNMRYTKDGTITYFKDEKCYEVDIQGNVLWTAPDDGKVSGNEREFYHHDFFKTNADTYICLGYYYELTPNIYNNAVMCKVRYNTIIEYNKSKAIIWKWNEKNFVDKSLIFTGTGSNDKETAGTHLNSVFYDSTDNSFLLSFRNTSTLMKIDKLTGKIVYQIGKSFSKKRGSDGIKSSQAFSAQHTATITSDGNILFYNNNTNDRAEGKIIQPHISILSQPLNGNSANLIWDYECTSDSFPNGLRGKEGSALELPNKNILVAAGGANRSFEITRNKEMVWECFTYAYKTDEEKWVAANSYRNNFVTSLYPTHATIRNILGNNALNINKEKTILQIHNDGTEAINFNIFIEPTNAAVKGATTKFVKLAPSNNYVLKYKPMVEVKKNVIQNLGAVNVRITNATTNEVVAIYTYNLL